MTTPLGPAQALLVEKLEAEYAEVLAATKAAAMEKAEPEVRRQLAQTLEGLNRDIRKAKLRPAVCEEKPAWNAYPAPRELPRCPNDARYVKSFAVEDGEAAKAFSEEHGFVVFHDVLSAAECEATVSEIWSYLEERTPGLQRDDAETWFLMSSERYGLPEAQAIFTPQVVANRQSPRVHAALDAVLARLPDPEGEKPYGPHPSMNSVVVSQDRWCVYRPCKQHSDWKTSENLHLDINPWSFKGLEPSGAKSLRYGVDGQLQDDRFPLQDFRTEVNVQVEDGGPHYQGALNLLDNLEEDGGTRVVPGFHKSFQTWFEALGRAEDNLAQSSPHDNWLLKRPCGGGSFKFSDLDPIHSLSHRVPMRAGSLLLWNHCTVHGSRANNSDRFRTAQFIRGFRAGELDVEQAWCRAASVHFHNSKAGAPLLPLAPHVFGVPRAEAAVPLPRCVPTQVGDSSAEPL